MERRQAIAEFQVAHAQLVEAERALLADELTIEDYAPIWQRANDAQRALVDMGAWPIGAGK